MIPLWLYSEENENLKLNKTGYKRFKEFLKRNNLIYDDTNVHHITKSHLTYRRYLVGEEHYDQVYLPF